MKVIVAPEHFDRLPEITEDAITEDEEDMLDLAVDLHWEMAKTAVALGVFMKGWESYGKQLSRYRELWIANSGQAPTPVLCPERARE